MNKPSILHEYRSQIEKMRGEGFTYQQITDELDKLKVQTTRQSVGAFCKAEKIDSTKAQSALVEFDLQIREWKSLGLSNAQISMNLKNQDLITTAQNVGRYCIVRGIKKFDTEFYPKATSGHVEKVQSSPSHVTVEAEQEHEPAELPKDSKERQETARERIERRKKAKAQEEQAKGILKDLEAEKEAEKKRLLGE